MNTRRHRHTAELKHDYYQGGTWYVAYGDQTEVLAEQGSPYEWDDEKRARVVGAAVAAAREKHDRITAANRHLDAVLAGERGVRPGWWRFWDRA